MKKSNKSSANGYHNRLWNDALHDVLLFVSEDINKAGNDVDGMFNSMQWDAAGRDTQKPPDESGQEEAVLKKATIDVTVQFNQLASVHNMDTIDEAAGIIRDIISA